MNIPIVISLIALIFSLFAFFYNYLKPFSPDFFIGTIVFKNYSPEEDKLVLSIIATILISNNGAKVGIIEDIFLGIIFNKTRIETAFPSLIVDEENFMKYHLSKSKDERLKYNYLISQFHPVVLKGREQKKITIEFWTGLDKIVPGEYDLEFTLKEIKKSYVKRKTVKLTDEHVEKIFKDIPISLVTSEVLIRRHQFDQTKDIATDLIKSQKK